MSGEIKYMGIQVQSPINKNSFAFYLLDRNTITQINSIEKCVLCSTSGKFLPTSNTNKTYISLHKYNIHSSIRK